ncbi:hypothetical protein Salat_1801000 [Sesamum alatum]|uniref:Uncharacterized protein n=1 Tax=Sesamum alatum TaxID=300844 RepID=A0AAE1Y2Q3_9LAMI|nr:hypothetical protein Salat_1801000 [Sesamum alatum]
MLFYRGSHLGLGSTLRKGLFQLGVLIGLLWRLMIVPVHLRPLFGQSLPKAVCSFGEDFGLSQFRRESIYKYGVFSFLEAWPGDISEWISSVFQQLSKEDQVRFLTFCWALWQHRNQALMEGKAIEPLKVVERAVAFLSSYQDARRRQAVVSVVPRQ